MKFENMAVSQINKEVGEALGYECEIEDDECWVIERPEISTAHPSLQSIGTVTQDPYRGRTLAIKFDPCNSWNDAGPIISDSNIDIEWPEKHLGSVGQISKYMEGDTDIQIEFTDKSQALRLCMVVYLMFKEKENGIHD